MTTENDKGVLQSIFSPELPFDWKDGNSAAITQENPTSNSPEDAAATHLEMDALLAAEAGDWESALEQFARAINLAPTRASCYNNRAQTLRLNGDTNGALTDLDKAIELSSGRGPVASQAFTQRATIKQLQGQNDAALCDYKRAAELGNEFAKKQMVALNPMAAMCNQMLSEMMKKLRQGQPLEE